MVQIGRHSVYCLGGGHGGGHGGGGCSVNQGYLTLCTALAVAAGLAVAAAAGAAIFIRLSGRRKRRGVRGLADIFQDMQDIFWVPAGIVGWCVFHWGAIET